jgi:beta-lactam-binding protein with PASTA domain
MTLGDARAQIAADKFTVGVVLPASAPDSDYVSTQSPDSGATAPQGSPINLGVSDTKPPACP